MSHLRLDRLAILLGPPAQDLGVLNVEVGEGEFPPAAVLLARVRSGLAYSVRLLLARV